MDHLHRGQTDGDHLADQAHNGLGIVGVVGVVDNAAAFVDIVGPANNGTIDNLWVVAIRCYSQPFAGHCQIILPEKVHGTPRLKLSRSPTSSRWALNQLSPISSRRSTASAAGKAVVLRLAPARKAPEGN